MITKTEKVQEVPKLVALFKEAELLFPDMSPEWKLNAALGAWVAKGNKENATIIDIKRGRKRR